ncbi:MAG: serine/threonine protein kinase [Spirochaetes bacterium]|nr:serine/threonine protein kinase [Spirochaetota bacterium]
MSEPYYRLIPDVIAAAVEKAGMIPTARMNPMNSYENRVYDVALDDGSHIVIKFYRPERWSREQIQEEHDFIKELDGDEIPVCVPLAMPDGSTVGEIESFYFAIWPRTGGRVPDELSDTDLASLGMLIARLHNVGSVKSSAHRIALTAEHYGIVPFDFLVKNKFLPASCIAQYGDAVRNAVDTYNERVRDVPLIRIHGDCHYGNFLTRDDRWHVLDFDDFVMGPAVQDIWMLTSGEGAEGERRRRIFLGGYRTFREFDESWLSLIEPLRALRYINYAGWIAKRWNDPMFPRYFPHFGTTEYWVKETADLVDQVAKFSAQPITDDETAKPTKKDYFWDMD